MDHTPEYLATVREIGCTWRENEPMSRHTSFKIGGPAALFLEPSSREELTQLLRRAAELNLAPVIVGRGSNLLVRDEGIDAPVICLGECFSQVELLDAVTIHAQAGASLTKLCRFAQSRGLSGLEFAYGIPGTVGGAVYMNAGAYGGEIKDVICWAEHLDAQGRPGRLEADALELSYRHSVYSNGNDCITGAAFELTPSEPKAILKTMEEFLSRRQQKQPLEMPSAGSTFKRPEGSYASALIDQCGLKGLAVGGAQVSVKHAGFVVNTGSATARDVLKLVELIQKRVAGQTGYALECEIKLL